jgi:signal transduction histidine kinase
MALGRPNSRLSRGWVTRHPLVAPVIVLLVGLLATVAATLQLYRAISANDVLRFESLAEQKLRSIQDRMEINVTLLRGAAGLFAASDDVSREDFARYVRRLSLRDRYPGVQGIGFTQRLAPGEIDGFLAAARLDIPDFNLRPPGPREEYHSILYLEPLDERNRAALGFDMFTNPARRQAMEQARDRGRQAASGKVELLQEIDRDKQAGFLIYLPVYRQGLTPDTLEERRAGLRGFVYSPYRAGDLFGAIFEWDVDPQLDYQVYDGAPEPRNLLYDSDPDVAPQQPEPGSDLSAARLIDVAGRQWTVVLATSPAFARGSGRELTPFVLIGGVLATFLLAGLAWSQGQAARAAFTAREDLQAVNADLEKRVADRTQALREAQNELRRINANLEVTVAERTSDLARANQEIQRFAYIVSHDLRAPLVNVMGFTSELEAGLAAIRAHLERAPPPADQTGNDALLAAQSDMPEAIGFIRSSTQKMDGLINAILKLSREGRRVLTPVPVDMGQLFEAAADTVRHRLSEAGGELIIEHPVPDIVSDRLALEQVFGNLLDNAVKYLDRSRPGRIVVRGREEASQLVFEVEDNGRGIAPEDHERVFDLFRRAGVQDQPGEGIGLSHVRALVRRLGGDIDLTSAVGRGTTFRVRLPKTHRESA